MATDFSIRRQDGSTWFPVVVGDVVVWALYDVPTHKSCHREFASHALARVSARRLVKRLKVAKTPEEFNAIIDTWYARRSNDT